MTGQCRPSRKRDFRNRPFFGKHHPTWPRRRRRRSPWMCNLAAMTRTQTESPSTLRAQRAEENAVNLSEQTGFQTVIPPSWQNGEPLPEHSQDRSAKLEPFVVLVTCGSCFLDQKKQKKNLIQPLLEGMPLTQSHTRPAETRWPRPRRRRHDYNLDFAALRDFFLPCPRPIAPLKRGRRNSPGR